MESADNRSATMESSDNRKKVDPDFLHTLVMRRLQEPVVFHGLIQDWPASRWTPEDLASVMGDKEVKIRIGLKEANQWASTQWESSCSYETTTLSYLCEWLRLDNQSTHYQPHLDPLQHREQQQVLNKKKNPLLQYDPDKYWCYMDYKYMAELFQDHPDVLQSVRWSDFGFPDRDGKQSTIWIGSQGATTPGHYDTYGCNLVAQIYGRKKWHLFPPHQSDALHQTRVPYEESSVFSPINVAKPDLTLHPRFADATPYVVTLDPGDVLFVPHHWWHFVETVETSVSVNTWIEMDSDHQDRFHEAITRALVSEVLPSTAPSCGKPEWLNPTEELCNSATNMKYLKSSLCHLVEHQNNQSDDTIQETMYAKDLKTCPPETPGSSQDTHPTEADEEVDSAESSRPCSPVKRRKRRLESRQDEHELPEFINPVPCLGHVYKVNGNNSGNCVLAEKSDQQQSTNSVEKDGKDDTLELFLEAVTHPEVVSLIGRLMHQRTREKK